MPPLRNTRTQVGRVQKTPSGGSTAKPPSQTPQQPAQSTQTQELRPKNNSKLVCQICGKVGHSARDCYYRNTATSAYRCVPYPKQSTEENRQFRRDFKQTNNRVYHANELSHTTNDETDNAEETERHDDVEDPKTSKATSSSSNIQKCAAKPTTTNYSSDSTTYWKPHGVAVPSSNLPKRDYKLRHYKTLE